MSKENHTRSRKPIVIRVGLVQYKTHTDQGWPSQCKALIYKQEDREERKMDGVLPYVHKALTRRYGHALKPPYQNLRTAESSKILNMQGHCTYLEGRKDVESNSDYLSSDLLGFNHDLPAIPSLHERRLSRTAIEEYKDVMSLNVKLSSRWAISCSFSPPNQEASKKKELNRQC